MASNRTRRGHRTGRSGSGRPLVSACLIVKDEEDVIARCIDSVLPLVDEVVVHDTGSADATVEVCRAKGARVIEGEWRDDFSWARNVAIDAARGDWVLIIDADEVLQETNFKGLRRVLAEGHLDAFRAQVHNAQDITGAAGVTHTSIRLFRQRLFRYTGRIHEQVTSIAKRRVKIDRGEIIELQHWGYVPEVMEAKGKAERNIHLAEISHEEEQTEKSILETCRAMSLGGGNNFTVIERLQKIRHSDDPEIRHSALQLGVQMYIRTAQRDLAMEWLDELLAFKRPNALTTYLHGYTLMLFERFADAIDVFGAEHDHAASLAHGVTHSTSASRQLMAECLVAVDRKDEAIETYLSIAEDGPLKLWPDLLRLLHEQDEMHRAVPAFVGRDLEASGQRLRSALAMLIDLPVEIGDAFAEALWEANPGDRHALAFMSLVGDKLPVERAIIWSARARELGAAQSCPLLRQIDELTLPAPQRVAAAAAAVQAFDDVRGVDGVSRAARDLEDDEVLESLYLVGEVAPMALEPFVLGVVSSQARALVMARALASLHANEQAAHVLRLGLEVHEPDDATTEVEVLLGELEGSAA